MSGTRTEHGWLQDAEKRADTATTGWFIPDDDPLEIWTHEDERAIYVCKFGTSRSNADALADAEFIAHARTDLPRALALIRTLGEALAAFTKEWTLDGHTNVHSHGAWVNCQECDSEWPCPTERIRAALSEFRSAVGEEPT